MAPERRSEPALSAGGEEHLGGAGRAGEEHWLPPVSVVIPLKNERDNVGELVERLDRLPTRLVEEVLFVDDSDDGTAAMLERLGERSPHDFRVIHRAPERRGDG